MTTKIWLWILAGLVVLGMGTWMVASGNKTAEAPTATTTTIIIEEPVTAESPIAVFPDNGEEKWK